MEIIFCDVIGCSSPANRFLSDGEPPTERLCSYHWARLGMDAPERANLFVPIDVDSQDEENDEESEYIRSAPDSGVATPTRVVQTDPSSPEPARC